MKNVNWEDVAVRAVKTFVESFLALLGAELTGVDIFAMDKVTWCAVGISAAAAGITAVWNGVIEPLLKLALPDK